MSSSSSGNDKPKDSGQEEREDGKTIEGEAARTSAGKSSESASSAAASSSASSSKEGAGGPWSGSDDKKDNAKDKDGKASQSQDETRKGGKKKGGFFRKLRNFVIFLLILAGAAAIGWYEYRDQLPPFLGGPETQVSPTSDMISPSELAALRARVEELETTTPEAPETPDLDPLRQQIGELEEQIASLASSGAAEGSDAEPAPVDLTPMMSRLDALAERLTAVDERVAALEARLRTATAQQVSPADLAAVRERLNSVTDAVSDNAALLARTRSQLSELQNADIYEAESMMLSLAVSRVRQAVEAGQPYAASLSALERFARASGSVPIEVQDALDTLKPTAEDGVASARELAESFERAAPRIIDAADVPPGGSWWQRTLANLRDVVTVRRVGDLEGDTVESIVARAEQAVEAGRIEQAVNELKTLEGGALEAAQVWIDEAEARQTALAALDGLDAPGPDAAAP